MTAPSQPPRWPVILAALLCVGVGLAMPILELLTIRQVSATVSGLTSILVAQALGVLAGGIVLRKGTGVVRRHDDDESRGSTRGAPRASSPPPPPPSGSSSRGSSDEHV